MEYNFLSPNCGLKVSAICLGTMTFHKGKTKTLMSSVNIDKKESFKILDKYVELGGNFIDTSNAYSNGEAEEIVGEWMKKRGNRENMIIATKVRFHMKDAFQPLPNKPNNRGLSREHILEAVEGSLKRLQTDYIDLYQIHAPDRGTPFAEVVRTMDELVQEGKILYFGACNLTGWETQKFVETCRELQCRPFVTLQSHYSLLGRTGELESFSVCNNEGLGLLPWSPLRGGLLTNKLLKSDTRPPKGTRLDLGTKLKLPIDFTLPDADRVLHDKKYWELRDCMEKIAKKHGKTISQVALRWLLQTPPVTSVIIGTTKLYQLQENMGAVGWRLSDNEMEQLNKCSAPDLQYPYNMVAMIQDGRNKEPGFV